MHNDVNLLVFHWTTIFLEKITLCSRRKEKYIRPHSHQWMNYYQFSQKYRQKGMNKYELKKKTISICEYYYLFTYIQWNNFKKKECEGITRKHILENMFEQRVIQVLTMKTIPLFLVSIKQNKKKIEKATRNVNNNSYP